jgi:hypothetical protein
MTGAEVTGQITVNGESYDVEAVRGYHDHNWGQWLFFGTMWDWAQVSRPEEGFSLDQGNIWFPGPQTVIGVHYRDEIIEFKSPDCTITHLRWEFDPFYNIMYPVKSLVVANNSEYRLAYTIEVKKVGPMSFLVPPTLPFTDMFICEFVSDFRGGLYKKRGRRGYKRIYRFNQGGFSEYTTTFHAPVPEE